MENLHLIFLIYQHHQVKNVRKMYYMHTLKKSLDIPKYKYILLYIQYYKLIKYFKKCLKNV